MKRIILMLLILILLATSVSATNVTIKDRHILLNGKPFFVKGVGYSPVPIGADPEIVEPYGDYFTDNYGTIHNRDLPLLRKIGTNTIRLWAWNKSAMHGDFLNKSYNGGKSSMYVIATFWMGKSVYPDLNNPIVRERAKRDFRNTVSLHKNNSAILMWAIGNELNAPWNYGDDLPSLFSLMNEMAREAHLEEGTRYHPITTVLADTDAINTIRIYNSSMTYLDVWGIDPPIDYNSSNPNTLIYRGGSFGNFFNEYKNVSKKPLLILEYGIDAYDDRNNTEYEKIPGGISYQSAYAKSLWLDIVKNSNVSSGGSIMAYSDEWWKGKHSQIRTGCPDNNASYHSYCGYTIDTHPDRYSNEEWWGMMRTVDNGNNPDIMRPRNVYYVLRDMWLPPSSITNLTNKTYARTYINWTWKDPTDRDFSKVVVYINGILKRNVIKGRQYYNATGLKNNTWYKINTHTIDSYGNINMTWKNHSARTAK